MEYLHSALNNLSWIYDNSGNWVVRLFVDGHFKVKTIALVKNVIEGKMEQKEKPPVVTEAKMLITFSQCEFWLHDKKDVANARSADQT